MLLRGLILLTIGSSLVQSDQFLLERYWGYVHNETFYLTPIKCLAQCSMDSTCCAFSFIAGVQNECHIFRECNQKEDHVSIDMKRVYYRKVEHTSQMPLTTLMTTTPVPPTTTSTTTTTTTTPIPLAVVPSVISATSSAVPASPPSSKPPATEPPTSKPATPEPPATKPRTPKPPATKPPTPKPPATKPPTPKPPATKPPTPKPPVEPIDPIFSGKCKGATKGTIGGVNTPFILVDNPWTYCPACAKHIGNYPGQGFDQLYRDDTWGYLVIAKSAGNSCDLLVECNKANSFANRQFYLNTQKRDGVNYMLRITWDGKKWLTTNDLKTGLPAIALNILCK